MNWPMMRSGLRMGWRGIKLGIQAFPNLRLVRIRFRQVGVCARVFFKGLVGVQSPAATVDVRAERGMK